jgi:hypothetical protein
MQKLLKILRDPIWQMLSVVVAVVAIFIAVVHVDTAPKELLSVHVRQGKLIDQWMPNEKTKVLIEGSNYDPQRAVADYFFLVNSSSLPISPSDFVTRLEVNPRQGSTIYRVQSCSQSYAQVCSSDGSTTATGGAYVHTEWKLSDGKWTADGPLINKDDAACILVISEPTPASIKGVPLAAVVARVKGYNFKSFESLEAAADAKKRWYHSFYTAVEFQGMAVYWLVALAGIFIFANLRLLQLSQCNAGREILRTSVQTATVLLCFSSAEILIDVFMNRGGNFFDPSIHKMVWPLLAIHLIFIAYLVFRALRVRRVVPEQSAT